MKVPYVMNNIDFCSSCLLHKQMREWLVIGTFLQTLRAKLTAELRNTRHYDFTTAVAEKAEPLTGLCLFLSTRRETGLLYFRNDIFVKSGYLAS
jgi:hypothetical protein